ncbi:hypothetical protein TARUN_9612 [Trichoderma arundinaceum]|uniref:RBR-type E3 ubiquitin transferase n=1 Tax=Trichoderma arundinaceum TaxID=490622 RepID=A0A395N938_TRIAR|nr:hypothetical protein TARUN_9612 [Trichoderma arundinaceum]
MSNQHPHRRRHPRVAAPAPAPIPARPRPIEQLHPVLLHLLMRMEVMPPGDRASITEAELAHAVSLAISMLPDDEQAYMVSRIMTDDDIAEERLNSPEVQDLRRRVNLSTDERRLLLRASPEPEEDDGEDGDNDRPCIVCSGRSDATVPCGCHYCAHCLRANIRTGLRSEIDFPPRCCRPFNEATIRRAQRPALVQLFRQLSLEYGVPIDLRVYCHDASCSSFIPPSAIEGAPDDEDDATAVGTCPSCGKETCAECGNRSHRGLPCREEEDEEALWDMMDDQGLAHCPICGVVMALRDGCNHMTCLCNAEFCYLCGRAWRTCTCPLYGAFHLRVEVRRRPGRRPVARGGRAHLAGGTEGVLRVPQLRYDPDDEIALAALEDNAALFGGLAPVVAEDADGWRDQPVFDSESDGGEGAHVVAPPRHNAGQVRHRDDHGHPQAPRQRQHNRPQWQGPAIRNVPRGNMDDLLREALHRPALTHNPFIQAERPMRHAEAAPQPLRPPPPPRINFDNHQYGHHPFNPPRWRAPSPQLDEINQALEQLRLSERIYDRHLDQMRRELIRMEGLARDEIRGGQNRPGYHPDPQPRPQAAPREAPRQYAGRHGADEAL